MLRTSCYLTAYQFLFFKYKIEKIFAYPQKIKELFICNVIFRVYRKNASGLKIKLHFFSCNQRKCKKYIIFKTTFIFSIVLPIEMNAWLNTKIAYFFFYFAILQISYSHMLKYHVNYIVMQRRKNCFNWTEVSRLTKHICFHYLNMSWMELSLNIYPTGSIF